MCAHNRYRLWLHGSLPAEAKLRRAESEDDNRIQTRPTGGGWGEGGGVLNNITIWSNIRKYHKEEKQEVTVQKHSWSLAEFHASNVTGKWGCEWDVCKTEFS